MSRDACKELLNSLNHPLVVVQGESGKAQAAAAARGKKAAKKARRKERDAALKAGEKPPPGAAAGAPPAAKGAHTPRTSSATATAAGQPAESASSTPKQTDQAGDVQPVTEDGPASEMDALNLTGTPKADTSQTSGSAERRVPAAAGSAGQGQTGDPDSASAERADVRACLAGVAQSWQRSARDRAGDGSAAQTQAGPAARAGADTGHDADALHAADPDTRIDRLSSAAASEDQLGQLLGDLGVSDNYQPAAQPQGSQPSQGHGSSRRQTVAPQVDAHLLCPITQVRHSQTLCKAHPLKALKGPVRCYCRVAPLTASLPAPQR